MIAGPPARWIAPSTPPPPTRALFAALTIAHDSTVVMSPWTRRISVTVGTCQSSPRSVTKRRSTRASRGPATAPASRTSSWVSG